MKTELQGLLAEAFKGEKEAIIAFFEGYLAAEVFVPIKQKAHREDALGFVTIEYEGNKTLPIFSKPEFITEWAQKELPYEVKKLTALLWMIPEDTWLYLDACQEYGRESSPWEIEKLKAGPDAIKDIVGSEIESYATGYEVNARPEEFEAEKQKLLHIFEAYESVKEASLISISKDPGATPSPMVGLTLGELEQEKLETLFLEIRQAFSEDNQPMVSTDARVQGSPHFGLFEDATPFYMRQLKLGEK